MNSLRNPINLFLGALISTTSAYWIVSFFRRYFFGLGEFTAGFSTMFGYPKRMDLYMASLTMLLFPISIYLIDLATRHVNLQWPKIHISDQIKECAIAIFKHAICLLYGLAAVYVVAAVLFRSLFIRLPQWMLYGTATGITAGGIFLFWYQWHRSKIVSATAFNSIQSKLLTILQVPLISLPVFLLPVPVKTPSGAFEYHLQFNNWVYALVFGLALFGGINLYIRAQRHFRHKNNFKQVFSPVLLSYLVFPLFLFAPHLCAPPPFGSHFCVLPIDGYHFGETLLPLFLLNKTGAIPYVDYVLAHGFIDMLPGVFAKLFTGKLTAETVMYGIFLVQALSFIVSLWIFFFGFGLLPAIFFMVSGFYLPHLYSITLLPALYVILFIPKLLKKPCLWLAAFVVTSFIMVLWISGMGAAFVLSLSPMAAYMVYCTFKDRLYYEPVNQITVGVVVIAILLCFIFTPLFDVCIGLIKILKENSAVNLQAYGIPLILDLKVYSYLLFKYLWIFLVPVLVWVSVQYLRSGTKPVISKGLAGICISLFALFIMPYSLGRIDHGHFSRSGFVTIIYLFYLVPVSRQIFSDNGNNLSKSADKYLIVALITLSIGFFAFSKPEMVVNIQTSPVLYRPKLTASSNPNYIYNQPYLGGIKNAGNLLIEKKHFARLNHLDNILNRFLDQTDSYLDLTNRNAHYFYMDKALPIESGAFYNLGHPSQQYRSLAKIKAASPKLILIGGDTLFHDGLTLSLRAYPLYRYLVLSDAYRVFEENGLTYMLRKDIVKIPASSADVPEQTAILSKTLAAKDLNKLPISWGHSFSSLKNKMHSPISIKPGAAVSIVQFEKQNKNFYKTTGADPRFVFEPKGLTGENAGLLVLDLECQDFVEMPGKLYYTNGIVNQFSEDAAYTFWIKNGINIIPVDLDPCWLSGGGVKTLRLDFDHLPLGTRIKLNTITLYQRSIE